MMAMTLKEEDDFLTKVIKVMYRRGLRIVSKDQNTTSLNNYINPTERVFSKLWEKGAMTWDSICNNNKL